MYMLFTGYSYYPSGGWNDYAGSYSSEKEALEAAANREGDWWHIVYDDKIIADGRR